MSVEVSRPRQRSASRPLATPLTVTAFILAAVPFLAWVWAVLNGYFGQDDFILTYRAAHAEPWDLGYLFQDYGEHLQPGTFLLAWLVTALAPLNHTVAVVPLLAMHAVTIALCWRVLVRLFGTRWAILPPFALFACSPLILFPTLWWAYAMQLIPLLLAMFAALLAHLRYLHGGRVRHAAATVLWTLVGLAFYEKAALIPALLLGVTVFLTPGLTPIVAALLRHRWVWLAHAVIIAGYAALYFALTSSRPSEDPVTSRTTVEFAYRSIVDTFLPGLLGGPLTTSGGGASWTTPPLAVRIAAVLLAATAIVVSALRHRRRVLLPWLFLAGYLAVDLALVAATRLGVLGPVIATDPRYLADAVPVAILCATFAFLPARGTAEPPVNAEPPAEPPEGQPAGSPVDADRPTTGNPVRLAVAALTVLVVAGATVSFLRIAPALQFREAREYVTTARAALADRPGMVIYDGPVPREIMISWFIADAFTSRVVGLVPESPRFDRPAEELYQLDSTGTPRPIDELSEPVAALPGSAPDCGYLVGEKTVRIPLEGQVIGRRVVRVGYFTSDAGMGTVKAGDTSFPVRFTDGLHVVNVVVTGSFTHIEVGRNLNLAPLCVTDVQVGVP